MKDSGSKKITGKKMSDLLRLDMEQALYHHEGTWYHPLNKFPSCLMDKFGYVTFQTKHEYEADIYVKQNKDVHVKGGIKNMPNYIAFSNEQLAILGLETIIEDVENLIKIPENNVLRKVVEIKQIIRNNKIVQELKQKYEYRCQMCEIQMLIGKGIYYIEVHHIKPLGNPHNGPDILENMIVVCPNCHILLDYGVKEIRLSKNELRHFIEPKYINYHNEKMYCNNF